MTNKSWLMPVMGMIAFAVAMGFPGVPVLAQKVELAAGKAAADPHGVLAFAIEELKLLAGKTPGGESLSITLSVDVETLAPFSFRITRKGNVISLAGQTPAETLSAVYTVMEQMGYRFEVTGPVPPEKLDIEKVAGIQVVTPAVTRRGIRQHINFNMDVSGYPLSEAREYIRNLARLRYNWMTFHSYPCHWTWDRREHGALFGDYSEWIKNYSIKMEDLVSGGYFYGGEFKIPDHPQVKPKIRFNRKYFCAPEFEDVIHKHPERGMRSQQWLRDLMQEVKRCGMTLCLSTELCAIDASYNRELANRIVKDYPLLNYLEIVSPEGGDFLEEQKGAPNLVMAREIVTGSDEAALRSKYPRNAVKDPLCAQIWAYANNVRTIRQLQQDKWEAAHNVKLICSSYACAVSSVKMEMALAEEFLPGDTVLAVMPGHSSREVCRNIIDSNIKADVLKRLLINNWLEFDGYMMLQQHTAGGLYDLTSHIRSKTGDAPVFGLACNHWRTAPNAVSFRYLGEAAMAARLSPSAFYSVYAAKLGVAEASLPAFASAMTAIDELSDVNAIAGNIGFNLGWDVDRQNRSFGLVWWWGDELLKKGRDRFIAARDQLCGCRAACTTKPGQATLDQLINGCNCAIEHLEGVLALKPFTDKYFDRDKRAVRNDLTSADEGAIVEATNRADMHFQKYLALLGDRVSDRGEEGMLLSYYYGPVVFCNNLRAVFGKQGKYIDRMEEGSVVPQPLTEKDMKAIGK